MSAWPKHIDGPSLLIDSKKQFSMAYFYLSERVKTYFVKIKKNLEAAVSKTVSKWPGNSWSKMHSVNVKFICLLKQYLADGGETSQFVKSLLCKPDTSVQTFRTHTRQGFKSSLLVLQGHRLSSKQPHGVSLPSVTPAQRLWHPLLAGTHVACRQNTHTYKINILKGFFFF